MYYFIIEKETNNIICKSLETDEKVAIATNPYEKDCEDYWTSIEIDGEVFDINIWFENEYNKGVFTHDVFDRTIVLEEPELIKVNIPDSLQLYKLRKDENGQLSNDWDDFVSYGLTFEQ